MFTPQQIQEKTFVKAVFGGYDMQTVDEFLEPLTEDYITLYKENAVLKSKMKVLVEKLEEYRGQEESMKKALVAAQKTCDSMVAEAEKKCAQMLGDAEGSLKGSLVEEEQKLENAKALARNFIDVLEKDITKHLDLLKSLKEQDLAPKAAASKPVFDFERVQPKVAPQTAETDPQAIASQIAENVGRIIGAETAEPVAAAPAAPKARLSHPESATIKFTDLQFGKNYDPKK